MSGRRLVVVRHGETEHNAADIWQGQLDSHLSPRGHEQALDAAPQLAAYEPVALYASDLSRAMDTANPLAQRTGLTVVPDQRFREIHAGQWQGMSGAQVREQFPQDMDKLAAGEDFARGGDGEWVADVADRSSAAARDVIATLPDGSSAVIVTHGVAARALTAALVGMPQQVAWLTLGSLRNAHWAELVEVRTSWRIAGWNLGAGRGAASESA